MRPWINTLQKIQSIGWLKLGLYVVGGLMFFGGIITLGLQTYGWLLSGNWFDLPANVILWPQLNPKFDAWVIQPSSWIGFHKIVDWIFHIPLYAFLCTSGALIVFLATRFKSK